MKVTLFVILMLSCDALKAMTEHEPGMEERTSSAQIERNRLCFREARNLGCGHPRENQADFQSCILVRLPQLSSDCHQMMKRLYQRSI